MDLAQELERAIPAGPPLPPPETRIVPGRRALRRRRAAFAVVAAGAVAAVALPFAVTAGGPVTRGHDPAPPPTLSGTKPDAAPGTRLERDPAATYPWMEGEVVTASPFDGLLLRPGTEVLARQGPLYPGKDTESAALRVRFEGLEYWAACEWDGNGSTCENGSPRNPFYTGWQDFVAKATSGGGMTDGPIGTPGPDTAGADPVPADLAWLSVDVTAGEIRAVGPGRLLDQQTDVAMPESFAPPGTPTAAALVADEDGRYLALFRGEEELIVVEATGHGRTLGELLAWARERYRAGEGLL